MWTDSRQQVVKRKTSLVQCEDRKRYDVDPMEACHVLLRRSWQSDKYSKHDGLNNVYKIKHGG